MNKIFIVCFVISLSVQTSMSADVPRYKKSSEKIESRVEDLIKRMTIDEKIGQLNQPWFLSTIKVDEKINEMNQPVVLKTSKFDEDIKKGNISSFVVTKFDNISIQERNRLQKIAMEQSRLGIPIIFGFDVIHGHRTIFPIPLGMAASWDVDAAKEAARIAAREAYICGFDMTFSPMVDISRDPRWGRISESAGEDVLLNSKFGRAAVEGYQGDNKFGKYTVGSCVKHFVGYGAGLGGRDYQFTELSERALRETYLPPFKECVDAGAVSVMSAFNDISGMPATGNGFAMDQILKKEFGFDGFVLSDWMAVKELIDHGIAGSNAEAAVKALKAGIDMEMTSNTYLKTLKESLDKKLITNQILDDAVRRVLRVKFRLGLFDAPYRDENETKTGLLTTEFRSSARKIAAESMVLLKNNGILPLKNDLRNILVAGEWAANQDVYGWWIGDGFQNDAITAFEGIKKNAPEKTNVYLGSNAKIKVPSATIVCVGENGYTFGENNSRSRIDIPYGQEHLIAQLKAMGHKIVVVVFNGRPLDLSAIEPIADAILIAWHPGTEAGNALADVLFGKVSPSGKLPCTFPKNIGQVPLFYSDRNSGRAIHNKYIDSDVKPLYPFGFGLSYATFQYSDMILSKSTISNNEKVRVSIKVTNTGKVTAKDVVQLYIHDKVASVTQPKKKLIDFSKIELKPSESKVISFDITPDKLAILDTKFNKVVEPGEFDVWIGNSSENLNHTVLSVK